MPEKSFKIMLDEVSTTTHSNRIQWNKIRDRVSVGHFPSTNPSTGFGPSQIYVKKFEAEKSSAKNITIFLLHDLCQYHGRYIQFIEWMQEAHPGLNFIAVDFVGHGLSSGTRGHFEKFEVLVNDFHNLIHLTEKNPDDRWFILGHGMGGLVALDIMNRFQESAGARIDGMILSNFILKFQSLFLQMEDQIKNEKNFLKKILAQSRPTRFFMGKDLLSAPHEILSYEQDPLIIHRPTLNSVKELQKKTQLIYQDSYFIEKPLMIMKSEFGNALSIDGMDYFTRGIKKELLTEKKYSLMKHDLYNERDREIVYNDILSWIKTNE
jgi:acylglycerol lipase